MQQPTANHIRNIYLTLTLFNTLAASFIWGVNTLFLLDAGLSNTQAFAANAFFTVGQVIFEVPTGVIADTWGRRASYLLGTVTLALSTLLYLLAWQVQAPFWGWALSSVLLGLGFTFFSGATEAWLVDALAFTQYKGTLESVMSKGQIVYGVAMLLGSFLGGVLAQYFGLGVPYVLRAGVLVINCVVAFLYMKDLGFVPKRSGSFGDDVRQLFRTSIKHGWHNQSLKWVMLAGPFSMGVCFYAFYAMQPYLLQLYGDSNAYSIAGIAAAIMAAAQILGGMAVPYLRQLFKRRTTVLVVSVIANSVALLGLGLTQHFWIAIGLFVIWGLVFAASLPVRQAYLNSLIPSQQRATVLSFDALLSSSGGVAIQPALGKAADVWSYSISLIIGAMINVVALPFLVLARKRAGKADSM